MVDIDGAPAREPRLVPRRFNASFRGLLPDSVQRAPDLCLRPGAADLEPGADDEALPADPESAAGALALVARPGPAGKKP